MATKRSIPVRILGQEYRIRSDADEQVVQRAACLVDETMQRIRSRTGAVDTLDLAVLAALNLANQVLGLQERPGSLVPADASRFRVLIDLVESVAQSGAAAS